MKKRKKKDPYKVPFKRYEILWKDAVHKCDDRDANEDFRPATLLTIGYLIKEYDNGDIVLANELDTGDKNWIRHTSAIPYGMIIEMREV